MTDEELICIAKDTHHMIYVVECYGTRDFGLLQATIEALKGRGYSVTEVSTLSITKEDE